MVLPIAALMMGMGIARKYKQDAQDAEDAATERTTKAEDRAFTVSQRNRTLREQSDADNLKASMKMAATPVQADPNMVPDPTSDNRDVGLPGTAPATQEGYRVGGKVLPDQASADKAVSDWNNPDATMARMSGVLSAAGKPIEAQDLTNKVTEGKVRKLQLDEAQRTALNKAFDDDLNKRATSFETLADFVSNSNGDGQAGAFKIKPIPTPDGKKVMLAKLNPDGTTTPTAYTFDNTPAGLERAKALLSRSVSAEGKLTHLHQQAQEEQAAAQLASQHEYQQGMLGVARQNAATNEAYRKQLGDAAATKAGAGAGPAPVWDDKADAFLRSKYVVKDETTGQVGVDGAGMKFAKTIALAKARQNGGGTTIALGEAFDVDSKLRAAAKGDAQKLNALRGQYLQTISGGAPAEPKPPADTKLAAAPPGSVVRAPNGDWVPAGQAAPAPAAAAAAPMATMTSTAGADKTLAAIEGESAAALNTLVQQRDVARQQLAAVAKSGDPKALALYARAVQQADAAVKAEAAKRLGNQADQFIQANP